MVVPQTPRFAQLAYLQWATFSNWSWTPSWMEPHLAAGERWAVLGFHILQLVHFPGRRKSCFITRMPVSVLVPSLSLFCERHHAVKLLQCVPVSCYVPARESSRVLSGYCHNHWCLRAVLIQSASSQL